MIRQENIVTEANRKMVLVIMQSGFPALVPEGKDQSLGSESEEYSENELPRGSLELRHIADDMFAC